jgi:hypothetical protein
MKELVVIALLHRYVSPVPPIAVATMVSLPPAHVAGLLIVVHGVGFTVIIIVAELVQPLALVRV